MITAKKYGKHGTRYESNGVSITFWPIGDRYASIIIDRSNKRCKRNIHLNRASAVHYAGEWLDPEQGGRYVIDNDNNFIRNELRCD